MATAKMSIPENLLQAVPSKWQIPLLVFTSLIFFLGVLFLSTLSVKEISERVPSRARSEDVDSISEEEGEDVFETPRKALFDHSDSEDDGFRTAKQKKEQLGSELTPHGRRSRRLQQTAEKKKKNL